MILQQVPVKQQTIVEQHWAETYCQMNKNYFLLVKYMKLIPEEKFV